MLDANDKKFPLNTLAQLRRNDDNEWKNTEKFSISIACKNAEIN